MKSLETILSKTNHENKSMESSSNIEVVQSEELMKLSGGDKEYQPIYEDFDNDKSHKGFLSDSVFNFFNKIF